MVVNYTQNNFFLLHKLSTIRSNDEGKIYVHKLDESYTIQKAPCYSLEGNYVTPLEYFTLPFQLISF